MNRRQKIIVSVTGIFLVLLILVGLTYAYFLTRINGNPNNTSISLTTANLQLDWIDGTDKIIDSTDVIMPGQFESSITFSVKNNGNSEVKDYGVILTDLRIKWASTVEGTNQVQNVDTYLEHSDTMKLTVCKLSNGECIETKYDGSLPTTNEILFTSNITSGETQEYKATLNYIDEGDQSADMNKTITARLDIIDTKNTAVLAGIVDNYTPGDIVQSNSTPRISTIDKNGNYKIVGLEPGNHTVSVKNKDNTSQGSKSITIEKDTKVMELNIDRSNSEYTLNGSVSNPYNEGILAYEIINNAQNKRNGTHLVVTPLTTLAEEKSGVTNYKTTGEAATFAKSMSYVSGYASKTWYYYDTYEVNVTTGKFTLSGKHSCTYNSTTTNTDGETVNCYEDMKNKYLYDTSASNNSNANNHNSYTKTDLLYVYKVTSANATTLKYVTVFNSPNEAERVLAPTTDDYGTSYYYRGDVEDNYVNFAGMCWRIVRIEGDGSVKLILEDMYAECNDNETETTSAVYTGNWSDGNAYVFGYDDNYRLNFLNYEGGLADSFKTFQTALAKKIDTNLTDSSTQTEINNSLSSKLKIDEWCYDDNVTARTNSYKCDKDWDGENESMCTDENYGAYTRIITNKKPSLNCTGTKLTKFRDNTDMYVGTLTADEIVFAGATTSTNYNYYLMNNYSRNESKGLYSWSLSPHYFEEGYDTDSAFSLYYFGSLTIGYVSVGHYSRPAVSLKAGSIITEGVGTLESPYVIG